MYNLYKSRVVELVNLYQPFVDLGLLTPPFDLGQGGFVEVRRVERIQVIVATRVAIRVREEAQFPCRTHWRQELETRWP